MSDTDPHRRPPRPQYGEYATPEEQRAAIKQPADWQLQAATDAAAEHPAQPGLRPSDPGATQPHWPQEESRPPQQPARASFGDRLVTFVLLGFGLSNVISSVTNAFEGGAVMRQSASTLGPTEEQLVDSMPGWLWTGMAIVYSVIWLVALFASFAAIRRGRRSFWIPLTGAIVAAIVVLALMVIAVGQHPELFDIVPSPTGTGGSPT
jgi:hypothetical protein